MPHVTGATHLFAFSGRVHGLVTSDFTVDIFTKDLIAPSSQTLASLAVQEIGHTGYYAASYTPTESGNYVLALSNVANSINVTESIDIDDSDAVVELTQDTPTTNALKPTPEDLTESEKSFRGYLLMVFNSDDWNVGRIASLYAIAQTELDIDGNWLTTPLTVTPGTYHIVIKNNYGRVHVFYPNLTV